MHADVQAVQSPTCVVGQKKNKKPQTTLGPIGGMETPQTPFFRLYFFAPLCSLDPLGVLFSAGGPTNGPVLHLFFRSSSASSKLHCFRCPCVWVRLLPVCLVVPGTDCGSTPSYEQRPRASCPTPGRSPPVLRAGSRWAKLGLAWQFGSPGHGRGCGAAKTAGIDPLLATARRRLGWQVHSRRGAARGGDSLRISTPLAANCSDVMSYVSTKWFLSFEHL
jgi:hypothetical protein